MNPTVLVVDDDAANRETLRALMEELPYPVMEAANVNDTLKIVRDSASELVLVLDVLLPSVEDGAAVLQAVRDAKRHAVVGITASPRLLNSSVRELLRRLEAPLVTKPFEIDTLLDCVSAASQRMCVSC